ncbi:MAG: SUKH-3 domain-containing protein [Ruminococcus flavefaciens]|nr:SUKH-3 domain-containing protein [Ruminococcus flavefaciens]
MTKEEFEKFKEIHNIKKYECDLEKFLKEAEEWSVRNKCSEQFKKAEMNNIIDFLREYGRFYFKRTEKNSGDVIEFKCSISAYCDYWKDFKQIAFRIGFFENANGVIEHFYILENGSFYSRDGAFLNEEHKKIADNTADFLDYITTVEYDYHAPISERTYYWLKKAGWYEGRKIDISGLVKECEKDGVFLTEPQKRFIEEFGGLYVPKEEDSNYWLFISDKVGKYNCFINIFRAELRMLYDEEIIAIAEKYGKNTVCIGEYGHFVDEILLTEKGLMLINFEGDIVEYGRTAMEGFNKMFE